MASLFHAFFSCCLGEHKKDDESTAPLLPEPPVDTQVDATYFNTGDPYGNNAEELHQKVAEIVNNGTDQMLAAGFLPTMASSSHLPTVSSGRPPSFLAGNGNFQPSQYSNSSGKPESPRRPPISQPDADQPVWEDGASGIEHPPQSFSDATAMYRNNTSTYGTFGTGTTFAGRRPFKIHRGRPSSTKRPLPNGIVTQANGILSPGEAADGSHQETSPTRGFNNVDPPLPSPPLQIRPISSEVGHTERALSSYNEKRQVHFESPPEELIVHYD